MIQILYQGKSTSWNTTLSQENFAITNKNDYLHSITINDAFQYTRVLIHMFSGNILGFSLESD
jgi:hypothetical protein